jgi:hypothetical protein
MCVRSADDADVTDHSTCIVNDANTASSVNIMTAGMDGYLNNI